MQNNYTMKSLLVCASEGILLSTPMGRSLFGKTEEPINLKKHPI